MAAENNHIIHWSLFVHGNWKMHIAATERGLCFIGSQNQSFGELSVWARKRLPGRLIIQDEAKLQPYARELFEYLKGARNNFTLPLDLYGTPFQLSVWDALCQIPYGQTRTYTEIANAIQKPASVRAVGTAIGANPLLITVPCHRVIGKNGSLTGYRGGLDMKLQLLELEKDTSLAERNLL
ncbi:methylated-DNA--[protein]-cysteine S-methyltransferase [Peribacillus saganii]|uniref:Methylated-DNA--protein-cysteine methyltransferase n=1 Tax=Peribacillus saganii TaxID=2303992 RepID=A0A372LTC8_9BACI|nr:methylated-DNA--[protein]-cysteine S-methyltransferase [Peribacillus saganii]RFU71052.1 methylated-DNA--[protein]-cysteine S-methyltransferase [Peribacillus saganii]